MIGAVPSSRWTRGLVVAAVAASAYAFATTSNPTTSPRRVIDSRTQIAIDCSIQPDMFPREWRSPEIRASAVELSDTEVERSHTMISAAMAKYPDEVLKRNLKAVFVARELRFFDLPYGGTNSLDTVYIANDGVRNGFSNRFLEGAFHHEFSSILLRNHDREFPKDEWQSALPKHFEYRGDGTQSVREGTASTWYDPRLNEQGFLSQYSTSSKEEDFNMIAEALMTGDNRFWMRVERYPALRKKAELVAKFYGRIDSALTWERLQSFAQARED
ncbi:MAG: putative zinc-binding metallopeptidase [Armatimonadetes bacterium]|nr:putative zinc-binding metallopeptidase [Armatimonadota bacterium]